MYSKPCRKGAAGRRKYLEQGAGRDQRRLDRSEWVAKIPSYRMVEETLPAAWHPGRKPPVGCPAVGHV